MAAKTDSRLMIIAARAGEVYFCPTTWRVKATLTSRMATYSIRDGAVEDRLKLYGFGKKRGDAGEYACQHEHHEGQLHRVDSFREIVDYQYLERVSYGTAQYETVPQLQGKALGDAKQIETCRRHGDADPCHLSYFFPHEEQERAER